MHLKSAPVMVPGAPDHSENDSMLIAISVLVVLVLLNGVLAMAELAMMTSRRSRLQHSAARGHKGAARALFLASDPTRFLSTVQVGITMIGILTGAFAENAISNEVQSLVERIPWLAEYSDGVTLVLVVLVLTYASLVLGELVPKRLALAYPEVIASSIAWPLHILSFMTAWPVRVLSLSTNFILRILRVPSFSADDVSEEDVRAIVARAASTGVFTPQEHALIKRTMRVGDLTVRDLMVPRSDIMWIEESTPVEELRSLIGTSPFSHFPVCRGGLDAIIGVVHIKDLITYGILKGQDFPISDVAHHPLFVPESMPALRLMDEFRRTKIHIAFVVDEHGGMQGLLTLNDLISALVGDVGRRGEEPRPAALRRDDGSWLFDGRLPLEDALTALSIDRDDLDESIDASTIAGLLLSILGRIPAEGESVEWRHWRLEVVDMDESRIDKILATRLPT